MHQYKNSNSNYVYIISFVASLGGLLFGYDTAVIAGAIGFIKTKYGLNDSMMGFVASSAIWGCIIGAIFAGFLSDKIGRKKVLIITSILFAISSLFSAIPRNMADLIIARFIGGISIGAASMVSPLYISESAPAKNRGFLVTLYQLAIVLGINLVYFINLIIARSNTEAWNIEYGWRYMLGSNVIPSILFFIMLFFIPESPRWLVKKGKEKDALKILDKINGNKLALDILNEIKKSLQIENGTIKDILNKKLRLPLIIGIILALFSQITGINAIIYYAPEIFKNAGFLSDSSLMQTLIIGITNTIFTFVALYYIDKIGRRKLLIYGVIGIALSLFSVAFMFYIGGNFGFGLLFFIICFIACFAFSLGPIPWVIISEIFPTKIRGIAMSIATVVLWFGVLLTTQFTPILLENFGGTTTFILFGLNAIILLIFTINYIPETKGKTLEELENL